MFNKTDILTLQISLTLKQYQNFKMFKPIGTYYFVGIR